MKNAKIRASVERERFRITYQVMANVDAGPERIWNILTNASEYSRWNSTVLRLEGRIALGEILHLQSTLDPKRTFKLRVREMIPEKRMVWGSGAAPMFKGIRTYIVGSRPDGTCDFTMSEVFSGLMLPLIAGSLPDFRRSFEDFASSLQTEAQKNQAVH